MSLGDSLGDQLPTRRRGEEEMNGGHSSVRVRACVAEGLPWETGGAEHDVH